MGAFQTFRNGSLAVAMMCAVAAPLGAETSTDYDHSANFRSYRTFSFFKVQTANPLFEQRVKDELTKDLTQAGWQMVPSGGDVAITAIGNVKTEQEYNTFYDGLGGGGYGWRRWGGWGGGGWGGGGGSSTTTVNRIPVGTLLVDMYDSKTHQMIWRGRSTDDLSDKDEKNIKKVDKAIDKMLNGFPPKMKG